MNNLFESKRFSFLLIGLLLLLVGITGIILLNSDKEEQISVNDGEDTEEVEENNNWMNPDTSLDDNEDYGEEISDQYEKYSKVKDKDDKKKKNTKSKDKVNSNKGNQTNNKGNGNKGSNSSNNKGNNSNNDKGKGNNTGGNKVDNNNNNNSNSGVELPPINVGEGDPTVPKLPNSPNPNKPDEEDDVGGSIGGEDGDNDGNQGGSDGGDGNQGGNDGNDGNQGGNDGNQGGNDGSVTPADRPDRIDTEPHNPVTEDQTDGKGGLSSITTTYGKGFRILPIGADRNSNGITAKFEFYNDSKEPIVLTDENIFFFYDKGVDDLATSTLQNSPVVVEPKQLVNLNVVTSETDASVVQFLLNGTEGFFSFAKEQASIKDTTKIDPETIYIVDDDYVEVMGTNYAVGTEGFKLESTGIVLLKDSKLGPIKKDKNGAIGLMKARIANTGNKDLNINKIILGSVDFETGATNIVNYPVSSLSLLGGNALPTKVKPKEIVEGYLPFYIKDGNHVAIVRLETNQVNVQFVSVEAFNIIK